MKKHIDIMKKIFVWLACAVVAGGAAASCAKTTYDDTLYANALVTVKPNADNTAFILQVDDSTALIPVNMTQSPYGNREVRALINFREVEESSKKSRAVYSERNVHVNWMDSILTKPMVANLGAEENDEEYGDDPVEMLNDWVTVVEDGYLTLRFRTYWGGLQKHRVNLVAGNAEDPWHVTFHHDAEDDISGHVGDALVAFKLDGTLPDTKGETVDLTLEWKSFSGVKTAKFKYCTR